MSGERIAVEISKTYKFKRAVIAHFPNGETLDLPPGHYHVSAPGIVTDLADQRCITTQRVTAPGPGAQMDSARDRKRFE